jgi:hypothetical protein
MMRTKIQRRNPSPTELPPEAGLILELLRDLARTPGQNPARTDARRRWDGFQDQQMQHVCQAGLAPLFHRAARDEFEQLPATWRDALRSADLTAHVRHGLAVDTATDVIDACRQLDVRVTLLKGISISDQHYPAPHLRPMGDIDMLVPERDQVAVESALRDRGYRPMQNPPSMEGKHHGVPLCHPEHGVWVEIHTALFPATARLRRNGLFSPVQVQGQSVATTFHGRPVHRLTDELQLVYIASSWIRDLCGNSMHPSFLTPLFDAVCILKDSGATLDWEGMLGWLDSDLARASLYILLAYLERWELDRSATRITPMLASSQRIVGTPEVTIIHAVLDAYLVGGRPFPRFFSGWHAMIVLQTLLADGPHAAKLLMVPWNLVFPPPISSRFGVRYQLGRLRKLLRAGERSA